MTTEAQEEKISPAQMLKAMQLVDSRITSIRHHTDKRVRVMYGTITGSGNSDVFSHCAPIDWGEETIYPPVWETPELRHNVHFRCRVREDAVSNWQDGYILCGLLPTSRWVVVHEETGQLETFLLCQIKSGTGRPDLNELPYMKKIRDFTEQQQ